MLGLGAVQLAQLTLTAVMVCRGFKDDENARYDGTYAHAYAPMSAPPAFCPALRAGIDLCCC